MEHFEIERKFLIRMPDQTLLETLPSSEIEQIYILSPEGTRERIRRRDFGDRVEYTHTAKRRISDFRRVEREEEISTERYHVLRQNADPERRTLEKRRYLYEYAGQCFEIDVFPFWDRAALMELELQSEEQEIRFPPGIEIIREVTSEKAFTNSAIARKIPELGKA